MWNETILKVLFHEITVAIITIVLLAVAAYLAVTGQTIPPEIGGPLALCFGYLFRGQLEAQGIVEPKVFPSPAASTDSGGSK